MSHTSALRRESADRANSATVYIRGGVPTPPRPQSALGDHNPEEDVLSPPSLPERGLPIIAGYEVFRQLGHGGMGIVYLAREIALNRLVAIKVVAGGVFADAEMLARFRTEAEAIARLQHPNIVQIFRVGSTDGGDSRTPNSPFIALEYVNGGTLADHVGKPSPPRTAARIVATLAHAIQYAHDQGIIHRDLKPGNVLLHGAENDGQSATPLEILNPKISDFGLAKQLNLAGDNHGNSHTLDGSMLGTPEYMSPEQAGGSVEIGKPTDIYGLGVILYELLTGRVPFEGSDALDTLIMVREEEPPQPSRFHSRLPRDLDTICSRCLQKDPNRRYASATDLARDLQAWLDGHPISARPVSAPERVWKWARRRPAIASLLVATVLLTFAGFSGIFWQWRRAEARATAESQAVKRAAVALEASENNLYFGRVHVAQHELTGGNYHDAIRVLDACRPQRDAADRRSWEWHYLKNSTKSERLSFLASPSWVWDIAVSPDGRYLATAAGIPFFPDAKTTPGELALWDAHTGELVRKFHGHTGTVRHVQFSPNGQLLGSSGYDQTVRLWNVADGQPIGPASPGTNQPIQFGTFFGDSTRCWFTSDSQFLDFESPEGWMRRSLTTGELTSLPAMKGLADRSSDGRLGVFRRGDFHIDVLSMSDLRSVGQFDSIEGISRATLSPDGKSLMIAFGDRVELYDLATGRRLRVLAGPTQWIESIAISPDGSRMAAVGVDRAVYVWETQRPFRETYYGHQAEIRSLVFSPDSKQLTTCDRAGQVITWDLTRRPRQQLVVGNASSSGIFGLGLSQDGEEAMVVYEGQRLSIFDMAGNFKFGRPLAGLTKKVKYPRNDIQFSADGLNLFGPLEDDRSVARRWRTATGEIQQDYRGHRLPIAGIAVSADGKRIATCAIAKRGDAWFGELCVWDVATGMRLHELSNEPIAGLALSTDGKRLAGASLAGEVIAWDVDSGRELWRQRAAKNADDDEPYPVWIFGIAFSPDGQTVATGGFVDGVVRMWKADSGQPHLSPMDTRPSLTGIAFTPDSRRVVAAGYDSEIRMWDVATGQLAIVLPPPTGPRPGDIAFTARPFSVNAISAWP